MAPRCPCDQGSPRVALQRVMSDTATPYIAADGPWEIIHDCQMTILSRVAAPKTRALTTSPPLKCPSRPSASYPDLRPPSHQPHNVEYGPCPKGPDYYNSHGLANSHRTMEEDPRPCQPRKHDRAHQAHGYSVCAMSELSKATESAFKIPFSPDRASCLSSSLSSTKDARRQMY